MKKFIIMAVSLLLTALLALAGCMYAIGENKAESKPYAFTARPLVACY